MVTSPAYRYYTSTSDSTYHDLQSKGQRQYSNQLNPRCPQKKEPAPEAHVKTQHSQLRPVVPEASKSVKLVEKAPKLALELSQLTQDLRNFLS